MCSLYDLDLQKMCYSITVRALGKEGGDVGVVSQPVLASVTNKKERPSGAGVGGGSGVVKSGKDRNGSGK